MPLVPGSLRKLAPNVDAVMDLWVHYHFYDTTHFPVEHVASALSASGSASLTDKTSVSMGRSFMGMPALLKLMTITALGALIPVVTTSFPNWPTGVFRPLGRHMSAR